MSAAPAPSTRLARRPMSLEEFDSLPGKTRAEYVDGVAVVSPPSDWEHNEIGLRLILLLRAALPDLTVGYEMGLELAHGPRRIPDVAAVDGLERVHWGRQVPHLVVEILSPATRAEDTLRKPEDYRTAGIGQCWIVDRERRTLTVLVNGNHRWEVLLEVDVENPIGSVAVGEHGVVELDLEQVFP